MSDEAHPPTNYYFIFGILMVAFVGSLGLGVLTPSPLTIALIFIVAALKAYLVLTRFIHLKEEPRFIKLVVIAVLAVVAILYIGLVPDIVLVVYGQGDTP